MADQDRTRGPVLRLICVAALMAVAGLGGCTSSSVDAASPTAAAPQVSMCSVSDADLAARGAEIWTGISAAFAGSTTNQFEKTKAVLISVCGRPVVTQYLGGATPTDYYQIASATKSVISTLVGIALSEGLLHGVDQTLGELLPARRAQMTPAVAAITLRQLLTMTAGLDADGNDSSVSDWISSTDFVGGILRRGITGQTGTWAYSSATSHLLAAIVAQATGRPVLDYAREKLFGPIGIDAPAGEQLLLAEGNGPAYDRAGFAWPVDHQGVNFGGGWLRLTPGDLLKLGQLYLDEGRYQGRQVVPAEWVREATRSQVETRSGFAGEGYGYQWWVPTAAGQPAYAAVGYGGQLVEVVPSRRLVAVFVTEVLTTTPYVRVDAKAYEDMVAYQVIPHLPA
ncbi:MAG: serine hydrolase [Lapillicoccus sp.]